MAAPVTPLRWFKVTILRDGKKLITYDIRATEPADAIDEVWRRFERSHSDGKRSDPSFDTQIEEH